MALIKLRGKYAVGAYRFAIVDADDLDVLSKYRWKAKPNGSGSGIYAIRTQKVGSKTVDIRMHRVVLGYEGSLDVDHINRNPLDNRRANLRIVSRSENALNTSVKCKAVICKMCSDEFPVRYKYFVPSICDCCKAIRLAIKPRRKIGQGKLGPARPLTCMHCHSSFLAVGPKQKFCTEVCKKKAKWLRQKNSNSLPLSALKNAKYCRDRRASLNLDLFGVLVGLF